jgi:hypothetical protein
MKPLLRNADYIRSIAIHRCLETRGYGVKETQRREIVQDKAVSAANEGAYLMYVTDICKRNQRSKQNCYTILRLRDFIDRLTVGKPAVFCLLHSNKAAPRV